MKYHLQKDWIWNIPEYFNLAQACTDSQGDRANKIAMIVEKDERVDQITYQQLDKQSSQFANALLQLSFKTKDRILIRLSNSIYYPIAFFGIIKAGLVAVPTSTLITAKELIYLAQDSGAKALICDAKLFKEVNEELTHMPSLESVFLVDEEQQNPMTQFKSIKKLFPLINIIQNYDEIEQIYASKSNEPAYLVYTSGTTGYPKGVLHAHRSILGRMPASKYWFDNNPNARIMHTGKFNWTYVLGSALMDPLYLGFTVVAFEGKNNPHIWMELIAKHQCTTFIGVPTIYRQIIQKTQGNHTQVPSLKHCMSAGEHLSDNIFELWQQRFKQNIFEAIGMSEFSYYISHNQYNKIIPGTAGFVQPGHQVEIIHPETLQKVAEGEEGAIAIGLEDPGLFLEYWNLPEETNKAKHDGYFWTGDYASYNEQGYISFIGRKDDIINTFGYRVSPHEIERKLKAHSNVEDSVALGLEIDKDKVLVVACIILKNKNQAEGLVIEEFKQYVIKEIADYKRPKIFMLFEKFPTTKNGKILRKELIKEVQARYQKQLTN